MKLKSIAIFLMLSGCATHNHEDITIINNHLHPHLIKIEENNLTHFIIKKIGPMWAKFSIENTEFQEVDVPPNWVNTNKPKSDLKHTDLYISLPKGEYIITCYCEPLQTSTLIVE